MTDTYAPELTSQEILNSIYYWIDQDTWAPGIAFPAGSANPTRNANCHDRDFYYGTSSGHLWQYRGGDYPAGYWDDLGTAANAITWCGTTVPSSESGNNMDFFNKYDTSEIYQKIDDAWRNVGSNKGGLPLGNDALTFTDISHPWRSASLGLILVTQGSSPLLATDQGLVVKKDISAGGFLATNQGEVWIGHGRADATDVPKIILNDAYTGYPTLYIRQRLWNPGIGDWTVTTPAHLDVGDINIHGHLGVGDTVTTDLNPNPDLDLGSYSNPWASVMTSSLWVKSPNAKFGVTAGDQGYDVYLHPQNPANGGLGLGTANYPFKWVDATTVFTNGINLLSGDTLYVGGSMAVLDDSHGFKCNTGATTYFSMMRSGYHGYVTSHFGNLWLAAYSDIHLNPAGNAVYCHKSFHPYGAGTYSQGDYNAYWNEVNAKSFPDRGCPIWIGAEDAKVILKTIKPHPTKKSANKLNGEEVPQFDYSNMHEILKPDSGGDGIKLEVLVYSMYHALMELIEKVESGSETLD